MIDVLRSDLRAALGRRDRREIAVLRMLIGVVGNAEAQLDTGAQPTVGLGNEVDRRQLSTDEIRGVLETEHQAFIDAAKEYDGVERSDHADELRARASIVERYLG